MLKSGIYKILNLINGKMYVGQAVNIKGRFSRHKSDLRKNRHINKKLQNAYNKYGEINLSFSILENCEIEKLTEREQYYMDTLKPIYNNAPAAGSTLGIKHSDEFKRKAAANSLGRRHTEAVKLAISLSHKGRKFSEAHKSNISKSRQGMVISLEHRNKISNSLKGRVISDYTKEKIIQSNKTRIVSEETKAKISASLKNYFREN